MDDERIRTSLLIDTDNIDVAVLQEVLRQIGSGARRLLHRRAYGSLAKAREFEALCAEHAIRFVTTTYAGTNGTDVALAIDAIDAIEIAIHEPGDEFVLVTSDCDFLPLAARLRELGFVVIGYGQQGKSAALAEYERVYDEFKIVARPGARAAGATRKPAARSPAAPASVVASPATAEAPASATVALLPQLEDEVRRILEAVPELRAGAKIELSLAAKELRAIGLLKKNAPSPRLFSKYPNFFELTPAKQPNKVRYLGPH